jgi:hypothetical protein
MLQLEQARALAQTAARAIQTAYPHHIVHLVLNEQDNRLPAHQHPAFGGSYDWHSCVHMHWSLVRLMNRFPADAELVATCSAALSQTLTAERLNTELDYLRTRERRSFERPYGWAWLLKLDAELMVLGSNRTYAASAAWRDALAPLAQHIAQAFVAFLRVLPTPVRHGVHSNTAFACVLALQWARLNAHWELVDTIESRARTWFADDMAHGVHWEPSGTDFLSPTLTEALLMSHFVPTPQFRAWFDAFLPIPIAETPLATIATPGDRSDGQLVHFDGLNFARAWCARGLLQALPLDHPQAAALRQLAFDGIAASQQQAVHGEFVATHWLASFLVLAETEYAGVL